MHVCLYEAFIVWKFEQLYGLVGARGWRPPWSPPWVPVTLGHCEVLYVYFSLSFTLYLAPALPALLFFLIFYSLFGPCPARPFIFPYLLLFIWPLPFPHGPAPCPALQDRRTDGPCPAPCPALPCLAAHFSESRDPFSESDCPGRFPFSESDRPGQFRRSIKTRNCRVGRTHAQTHCCNYI